MRILLSAYGCDPDQGSEPGVGWAWAYQLARLGHDVCVLTRDRHRASIEARLQHEHLPNLRFIYFDVRWVPYKIPGLSMYPYYYAWQLKAYLLVKRSVRLRDFDCVHHITWGTYRTPFFLAFLPIPAIFGPVGGGETTPPHLLRGFSSVGKFQEQARRVLNFLSSLNPITLLVWRRSALILASTEATLKMVSPRYRRKSRVLSPSTPLMANPIGHRPPRKTGECRALFVGRFLEWKGLHLAIRALALARRRAPGLSLGIRGEGKCEGALRSLVRNEGLESCVEWIPRFSVRTQVLDLYDRHDVLVFPSLHDSSGMVVLEALSRGVPVICLNLGGPALLVDSSCGVSVATEERSEPEVVEAIAEALLRFTYMSDAESEEVRRSASKRASQFSIEKIVEKAYLWFAEDQSLGYSDRGSRAATDGRDKYGVSP